MMILAKECWNKPQDRRVVMIYCCQIVGYPPPASSSTTLAKYKRQLVHLCGLSLVSQTMIVSSPDDRRASTRGAGHDKTSNITLMSGLSLHTNTNKNIKTKANTTMVLT